MLSCQNGTKMRYKPKKWDIFEVKMKILSEISYKIDKKEIYGLGTDSTGKVVKYSF